MLADVFILFHLNAWHVTVFLDYNIAVWKFVRFEQIPNFSNFCWCVPHNFCIHQMFGDHNVLSLFPLTA